MAMVIFFEAVPPRWYGPGGSLLTTFIALATLCGPLIGGAISEKTTWRWIFFIKYGTVTEWSKERLRLLTQYIKCPCRRDYHGNAILLHTLGLSSLSPIGTTKINVEKTAF
jgi:hypothetical protein